MNEAPARSEPEAEELAWVARLEAAVGAQPSDGAAWGRLGRAYRKLGQEELALQALRRAADLGTCASDDWYWLSILLSRGGDPILALAAARVTAELARGLPRPLVNLASELRRHHRPHEALPYLEEAVRLAPAAAEPMLALGMAYYDVERYPAAAECLEASLRLEPEGGVDAWVCLGVSLHEIGRHEAAIHAFETALFAQPDYGWAWGRLGKSLRALGRHVEALAAFGKALQHDFAPPRLLAEMGDSAAEAGNVASLSEAIRRLKPLDRKTARALGRRLDRLQPPAPGLQPESPSPQAPAPGRKAGSRGSRKPATGPQAESAGSETDAPHSRLHRTANKRETEAKP